MSDDIEKQLEDIEAMFVQVARNMTMEGDKVTFHGLAPATLFFSDRPQRVVGHLSAQQFVAEWSKGENSFAADPPNAVISFLAAADETPEDAIVVLKDPGLEGDAITYSVDILEGSLPDQGRIVLGLHRPLRPPALAGVAGGYEPPRAASGRVVPGSLVASTPRLGSWDEASGRDGAAHCRPVASGAAAIVVRTATAPPAPHAKPAGWRHGRAAHRPARRAVRTPPLRSY